MKKILLSILLILTFATSGNTATYYACIAGNISAANAWEDSAACDGTTYTITGAFPASGSVLEANAQAMTIDTDPGPNGAVTLQNTAGGSFAVATSVTPLTINANITSVGAACLAVTGNADANPALTIIGTITGGGSATYYGVGDSHTVGTVVVQGAITGGGNATAVGYRFSGATGSVTITGNAKGVSGPGVQTSAAGTMTLNGDCIGSAASTVIVGCASGSVGAITCTGNLVQGSLGPPYTGPVVWVPSSAQKYYWHTAGTDVYASAGLGSDAGGTQITGANTAEKVAVGTYFVKKDDGVFTQGTASSGGGFAWAQ